MNDKNNIKKKDDRKYQITFRELLGLFKDKCLKNLYFALIVFFFLGGGFVWLSYILPSSLPQSVQYILRSIGGSCIAAAFITIIARIFVIRHYKEFENTLQKFVRTSVQSSLEELKEKVKSLVPWIKHLYETNVTNVYANRKHAAGDMKFDIALRETSTIQIAGISLNDFVQPNSDLHEVWVTIIQHINRRMLPIKKDLSIRVLIVHPDCLGAELRSIAEHRREPKGSTIAGRLRRDVNSTADLLDELEDKSREINTQRDKREPKITFEARVYSLTPMFFMFRTDNSSYFQRYYFWDSREVEQHAPAPLMRYSAGERGDINNFHQQMGKHFEWIWRTASVPVAAYLREHHTGRDKGLIRARCLNVYNSTSACRGRILSLLKNAKGEIDILGISLRSFFNEPFFQALWQAIHRDDIRSVRILIIDRHCQQAVYRSYREYLLDQNKQQLTFDEYKESKKIRQSELWRDTEASLLKIKNQFLNIHKVKVQLYHCAPTCFLLAAGESALVEQYHYGKVIGGERIDDQRVLGKDMPVYEYRRDRVIELDDENQIPFPPENLVEEADLVGRAPFELVKNHFNHIWDHYSRSFDPNTDL